MILTTTYRVTWETDGQDVDLPEIVKVPHSDEYGPIDEASDWLSDEYGWLVLDLEEV